MSINSLLRVTRSFAWSLTLVMAAAPSHAATAAELRLIDGFERIVFGSEIPGFFGGGAYLKRFETSVRFHVEHRSALDRRREVRAFLRSLDRQIAGLRTEMAKGLADANFVVHIVDRADYQRVGQAIYRNPFMTVPGDCVVRSNFGRRGISRSDALIVSDEGDSLFRRCLIEEVLQGLGPLNDNPDATNSVFNDSSVLTRFGRYDRIMLNVLYDDRLWPGMSAKTARPLLEAIVPEVARRIR